MSIAGSLLLAELNTWLTPVWLLSAGATLGLLVLVVLWGVLWLVSRRVARQVPGYVSEGILLPIFYLLVFLAGFTFLAAVRMPYPQFLASFSRIGASGETTVDVTVPPRSASFEVDVAFETSELKSFEVESSQDIGITTKDEDLLQEVAVDVQAGEPEIWNRGEQRTVPFLGSVDRLFVINDSDAPAEISMTFVTEVEYPQVYAVPITAVGVMAIFLFYFILRLAAPKVSAVAVATAKQGVSQPIYYLALALGAFALVSFIIVPYNTFGEDVKMLKDSGLTLILVLSIIVAMWTASVSISEEIEGRTALTLLSKPIGRREFILGKFLGILWPLVLMFLLLGFLFLVTVSYKVVYDARETASTEPVWQDCYLEMIRIVPGLCLAFMETVVLAAISVAISTRLPMLANLIICASIYVMGHLVPMIVESSVARFEIVRFVGLLIATIFPVLDHFNIQAAVAAGAIVPLTYLLWALLYCLLYSSIAMLLALFLFEDRDLA